MICFRNGGEEVEIVEPAKDSRPRARVRRLSDGKEFEADYWELVGHGMGAVFWGLSRLSDAKCPTTVDPRWGITPTRISKRRALQLALEKRGIE